MFQGDLLVNPYGLYLILLNTRNIPYYMFVTCIEKAFYSVSHAFFISVLRKFGFGASFIQWIRILLCNQESCIMNNGHSSGYFKSRL